MSTKHTKKTAISVRVNTLVDTAKKSAFKVNEFALNTTENIVLDTITVASQWQKVTDKALKGGLKLTANQQAITFDALEAFKGQFLYGRKKLNKFFA